MELWTAQGSDLDLFDALLEIDPKRGYYWKLETYRKFAPKLWEEIETNQVIWCCRSREQCIGNNRTEQNLWTLNVPDLHEQLVFYKGQVWDDLIQSRNSDWENPVVGPIVLSEDDGLEVVVKLPIKPEWIICHSPLETNDTTFNIE